MSNIKIVLGKNGEANITFFACKLGNYMTAGKSTKIDLTLHDTPQLRAGFANLFQAKAEKFDGLVTLHLSGKKWTFDSSIWMELVDVLLAFFMNKDLSHLLEEAP